MNDKRDELTEHLIHQHREIAFELLKMAVFLEFQGLDQQAYEARTGYQTQMNYIAELEKKGQDNG
jgi:hypothetical protein